MKKLSIIASIVAALFALQVSAAEMKQLKDGTNVEINGDSVMVVDKDGHKMNAPDGAHELNDGSTVVTKDGKLVK